MTLDTSHIQYQGRMHQFHNFTNLRFGKLRPIDIDGFLEIRNRLFIFIESKSSGAPFGGAQRMALERLTDAIGDGVNKFAYCIISRHDTPIGCDVDAGNSIVEIYRHDNRWIDISVLEYTVHDFIQSLIKLHTPDL